MRQKNITFKDEEGLNEKLIILSKKCRIQKSTLIRILLNKQLEAVNESGQLIDLSKKELNDSYETE